MVKLTYNSRWCTVRLDRKLMEARDKKIVELYQQGITPINIRRRFGNVDVHKILRRYGVKANQEALRRGSEYPPASSLKAKA